MYYADRDGSSGVTAMHQPSVRDQNAATGGFVGHAPAFRLGSETVQFWSHQRFGSETMTDSMPETPVLDLLASMTADSLAASSLDPGALMLVRLAALVAVDAPPSSYLLNLEAAGEVGLDAESVRGVLAAVAPIVGTARVASATGKIVKALSVAIEIAEEDAQYGE
jgi:alkylhydroperoxidase/carboxymuconolactone decarboxylase family protein YurZ